MYLECRRPVFLLALLFLSFTARNELCSAAEQRPINELVMQMSRLDDLWKAGDKPAYYREAVNVATDIAAGAATDARCKLAIDLLESLLAKGAKTTDSETGGNDLPAMNAAAMCLLSYRKAPVSDRTRYVRSLSRLLGNVRKELIPNYAPRRSSYNVAPPTDIPFGFAGMDPKGIRDPVARAKYEASIRENEEDMSMNWRQSLLRDVEWTIAKPTVAYMVETFRGEERTSLLVVECITDARLTDAEKKDVESAIASGKRKRGDSEWMKNAEQEEPH